MITAAYYYTSAPTSDTLQPSRSYPIKVGDTPRSTQALSHWDNKIMQIAPIIADTGHPAQASQHAMAALRSGHKVSGALVAVTPTSIHVFRPATAKGAHKSFDNYFCDAAGVVRYQDQGYAVLGLFGGRVNARAFSIPSLRELASLKASDILNVRRFCDAVIAPTGNILGFTGPLRNGPFEYLWYGRDARA